MTIMEAIGQTDNLVHNAYTKEEKIRWLSRMDEVVKRLIIDTHEGGDGIIFNGYDEFTPMDTVLLVPSPFDEIYLRWLEAQIHFHNGEYDRYNAVILLYNTAFEGYRNHYNATHMPKGKKFQYF